MKITTILTINHDNDTYTHYLKCRYIYIYIYIIKMFVDVDVHFMDIYDIFVLVYTSWYATKCTY